MGGQQESGGGAEPHISAPGGERDDVSTPLPSSILRRTRASAGLTDLCGVVRDLRPEGRLQQDHVDHVGTCHMEGFDGCVLGEGRGRGGGGGRWRVGGRKGGGWRRRGRRRTWWERRAEGDELHLRAEGIARRSAALPGRREATQPKGMPGRTGERVSRQAAAFDHLRWGRRRWRRRRQLQDRRQRS